MRLKACASASWIHTTVWLSDAWRHRHGARETAFHLLFGALSLILFVSLIHYDGFATSTTLGPPVSLTCRNIFWMFDGSCGIVCACRDQMSQCINRIMKDNLCMFINVYVSSLTLC